MQSENKCGKMVTKGGYLLCPICHRQKVLRLLPETRGQQIVVYCKTCKQESIVNIDKSLSHSA